MSNRIRVLIADDHIIVRSGLRLLLEAEPDIDVVGEALEGGEALILVEQHLPDVVLMDIAMPGMDGLVATRLIKTSWPQINVLALTMTNDGPPIPEEHIERIFEPFFTTKPDGTGLGLSICHSIVQQHGGAISVENLKDGKGVRFTITLPIARPTSDQEAGV